MLATYVFVQSHLLVLSARRPAGRRRRPDERGQASAEYALVLLGAAAVALLVTAWAARTDRVGRLLDGVMDRLLARAR
ncbi:MAG: DUF4244 domain-containing protein [Actinomycetota bacterium]|nr:DUF4244 domain-containing protein [Actinomycetota bacterium]